MPNCTAYAWGRFFEITGTRPTLSTRDAERWYLNDSDGYNRGLTPKVGAVICWRKGSAVDDSDGSGHVGIVEAVNDDGSIVTTESAWGGYYWREKTRTNSDGRWGAGDAYTFQGFIYSPIDFDNVVGEVYNPKKVWDFLVEKIGNEYGVAGLMGNLDAESGLYANRLQGDIPYSEVSEQYTATVDLGIVSEYDFVHNGPNGGGYGLAQWTYSTRKQALYDMWKSGGYDSIGSLSLGLNYLWKELTEDFAGVLSTLKSATSIRVASDKVLSDFERPQGWDTEAKQLERLSLCQKWYDKYAGSAPDPDDPVNPTPGNPILPKKMSLLLLIAASRGGR